MKYMTKLLAVVLSIALFAGMVPVQFTVNAAETEQQPVLAFGNSSGDLAMEIYTISGNPYRNAAYMVLADDDGREYGNPEDAEKKKVSYEEQGIGIISMRDDFKTIYGDEVQKTEIQ